MKTKDQKLIIKSPNAFRLSKYFIRNHIFSTLTNQKRYNLKVISSRFNDFPRYSPSISYSQMIQFSFISFCSLYGEKYKHRIVRFVHYFLSTGNPILDFSYIPLSLLDEYFSSHLTLKPLFHSILDLQIISGIQCRNYNIPHFLISCADFFQFNTHASILSLPNCNLKTGGRSFAKSIQTNQNINLKYLDLSQNNIEDINELVKSFKFLSSSLFYLNLNGNFLDLETTTELFNNIKENHKLHDLTHILINNSIIDSHILANFSSHITEMVKKNKNILTYLDLGSINEGSDILFRTLADYQVPLECLKIAGSHLDSESINHFYIFLSNALFLQELDISDTNFDTSQISTIINLIQTNKNITSFTLHVNSMKLNGERLISFINNFQDQELVKWVGIGLEDNDIDTDDLHELIKLFKKMINLSWINLSNNFTSSMNDLDCELIKILSIPRLNFLGLRGNLKKEKKKISNKILISFITALNNIKRPIGLDLRYNKLKDETIIKLSEAAKNNKLSELLLECNKIKNFELLVSLCRSIRKSNLLISFNFPLKDFHNYLNQYKMRITKSDFHAFHSEAHHIDNARIRTLLGVMKNQTSLGYHSNLSFQNIPQLDNLIDESVINLHNILKPTRPFKHSIFSETIGLPLPFQTEKHKASDATNEKQYDKIYKHGAGSFYYVPELLIIENTPDVSIQYNSLCIRRPGAITMFQIPDSISTIITDSLSSINLHRKKSFETDKEIRNSNLVMSYRTNPIVNETNHNSLANYRNSMEYPIRDNIISKGYISKIPNNENIIETCKPSNLNLSDSNTDSIIRIQSYSNLIVSSTSSSSSNEYNLIHSGKKEKSNRNSFSESERKQKSNKKYSSESSQNPKNFINSSDDDEEDFEYYEYIIEEEEEEYFEEIEYLYEYEEDEVRTDKSEIYYFYNDDKVDVITKGNTQRNNDFYNSDPDSDFNDKRTKNKRLYDSDADDNFIDLRRRNKNFYSSDTDDNISLKKKKDGKNIISGSTLNSAKEKINNPKNSSLSKNKNSTLSTSETDYIFFDVKKDSFITSDLNSSSFERKKKSVKPSFDNDSTSNFKLKNSFKNSSSVNDLARRNRKIFGNSSSKDGFFDVGKKKNANEKFFTFKNNSTDDDNEFIDRKRKKKSNNSSDDTNNY